MEKSVKNDYYPETIVKEKNEKLYKDLVYKHQTSLYKNRPNYVGAKLEKWYATFQELEREEQAKVLLRVLSLSLVGFAQADLTAIGGSSVTGNMKLSKEITKLDSCKLLTQSATGLFVKELDLKAI